VALREHLICENHFVVLGALRHVGRIKQAPEAAVKTN